MKTTKIIIMIIMNLDQFFYRGALHLVNSLSGSLLVHKMQEGQPVQKKKRIFQYNIFDSLRIACRRDMQLIWQQELLIAHMNTNDGMKI